MLLIDAKAVVNPETPLVEVDHAGVLVRLTRNVENTCGHKQKLFSWAAVVAQL